MADMGEAQILQLKEFILLCTRKPEILHIPKLEFFKKYLESLGARIPEAPTLGSDKFEDSSEEDIHHNEPSGKSEVKDEIPNSDESSDESEVELDTKGVIEPENDEPQPMGDPTIEVTEEMEDKSCEIRSKAQEAVGEGNFDDAIKHFTEAILINPLSAALYAKRAGVYIKLQKPLAAIRDCDHALTLNPDQAVAFKFRGRANSMLGRWEEAALDLANSQKIDYSDDANEWLKEVMPNAKKIQEHRRKYERKAEAKLLKEREARLKAAKEAREKAAKEENERESFDGPMPGAGPDPAEMKKQFEEFLKSPEVVEACKDPEVSAALQDIIQNPNNFMKYMNNEKVMTLFRQMMQ